ncbi:MAG: tyrosine-type recombinase/integrase, partial [Bacteroidales bacterium]|nr:tyrosine-type recombinase/integrase [Bacteroidales bacterium]
LVCEKAGLTEVVSASKTRAGATETAVVPKYSLVTVHTARRSFATNLYLAGMDIMSIKKMTGHHTEKSFLKYIRVSEEENAEKAAKHAFFQ